MTHFDCTCNHSIKIHGPVNGQERIDITQAGTLIFRGECLHYECTCTQFIPKPLPEHEYVERDDDYVCGYEIVAFRENDLLARKCWECHQTISAEKPRYVVKCFSYNDYDDVDYLQSFTNMDEPPTFANMVMCVDCLHLDAADATLEV